MDNIKYNQLKSLAATFVSPFLKKDKLHRRIFIVSDDFEARIYMAGEMYKQLEEKDKEIKVIEMDKIPRDFVRGEDYAIGLDYYLASRDKKAVDFGEFLD